MSQDYEFKVYLTAQVYLEAGMYSRADLEAALKAIDKMAEATNAMLDKHVIEKNGGS